MADREDAIALCRFLAELVKLREAAVRDISQYEQVLWAAHIPRDQGCHSVAWDREERGDVWIEVRKPLREPHPDPPGAVSDWVLPGRLDDSSIELPELSEALPGRSADDPPLLLSDHPDVQTAWDSYIEDRWWPWAERDRHELRVQAAHRQIFEMYQRQQHLGETFEVVLGLGFLSWRVPGGQAVGRHLVALRCSVEFDVVSGTLTVGPAGEGARPAFEQDMLDPQHRPVPEVAGSLERELGRVGDSIWEPDRADEILRSWVSSAQADGMYSAALEPPASAGDAPVVHFAPALILRRRTGRPFRTALDDMADRLSAGEDLPEGLVRFLDASGTPGGGAADGDGSGTGSEEVYFPLPASDAQLRIASRLAESSGVLVQGPPGTGKSHTIVNLVCHLLAGGRRVLVTSHAVRALGVLRGMIAGRVPEIAPLSVVLLGDDHWALTAMEESVQGITARGSSWDPEESRRIIAGLEQDLDRERRRQARILADLRAIREGETIRHPERLGYGGTLAQIAASLAGRRKRLGWIPGHVPEELDAPLTGSEFGELVSLIRDEAVSEWERGGHGCIALEGLPDAQAFGQAVRNEAEASVACEGQRAVRARPEYRSLEMIPDAERDDLAGGLGELIQLIERVHRRPLKWVPTAVGQILGDSWRSGWRELLEDTQRVVESTAGMAGWLDGNPITPDPGVDLHTLREDASRLLRHLECGGGWGFGPFFRPAAVRQAGYIRRLRIGGRPCDTAETVADLVRRVNAEIDFGGLRERWKPHHQLIESTFVGQAIVLSGLCDALRQYFEALSMSERLAQSLARMPGVPQPDWSDMAALRHLQETLSAAHAAKRLRAARAQFERAILELDEQQRSRPLDPAAGDLRAAIDYRSPGAYTAAWERAAANAALDLRLARRRELGERLAGVAADLGAALTESPGDAAWDRGATDFEDAWNWSRMHAWATRMAAPGPEGQHLVDLGEARRGVSRTIGKIAAEKAWGHCLARMTESQRAHLEAWSRSIRSAGTGRGGHDPMRRRNAMEHLDGSRSAIPAWIMPLHRVAETFGPGSETFDVAIIDEASLSGPEALLLTCLARKLVVVGDEGQMHPTHAGVSHDAVRDLRDRHVGGLALADTCGVDSIFLDLAQSRYGDVIRLREHFRCMPEIIEFSNRIAYQGDPLIPLRQYGAGRPEPTIAVRRVRGGHQTGTEGSLVNRPEAEAIVDEIVALCGDDAHRDRTMGVISLDGVAQAREIEGRLREVLTPEEIERRRLLCADARAFQGDGRDVMFLSMVAAPTEGRAIGALTDRTARRRFNVAASSARDQMYLFHSATLADLDPQCLRHQLLEYCLSPGVGAEPVSGPDVAEIEERVHRDDRQGRAPPPFDSWFEVEVFLQVVRRGYRVMPQFEVGGHRIDLVVQGLDGSLAVECDGDSRHGPDRYEEDAALQRDLERCGWTFWRLRESSFRLDPEGALEPLWATLTRRGIFPSAADVLPQGETSPPAKSSSQGADGDEFARQTTLSWSQPAPAEHDGASRLAPHREWKPRVGMRVPNPRHTHQDRLARVLVRVVKKEGPVVAIRAYRLINGASGSRRLTGPAKLALNMASGLAQRKGLIEVADPLGAEDPTKLVLRVPGGPRVVPRERGSREIDELPPDEVATMLRAIRRADPSLSEEGVRRLAAERLNLPRLTENISEFLQECMAIEEATEEGVGGP